MLNKVRFLVGTISLIKINMCCEINPNNYVVFMSSLLILSPFYWFLSHFIDHFYNIFRSSKSGPWWSVVGRQTLNLHGLLRQELLFYFRFCMKIAYLSCWEVGVNIHLVNVVSKTIPYSLRVKRCSNLHRLSERLYMNTACQEAHRVSTLKFQMLRTF